MTSPRQNRPGRQRQTLRLTCSITTDGKLSSVNEVMWYVLGYSRAELVGSSVGALLRPGEDVHTTEADIMAKFDKVRDLDNGQVERYTSWMLAKDQVRIDCDSTVAWNHAFQCWDVIAIVDAAQIAHRPRPQFPPDDPEAQLARLLLQENATANQHALLQKLSARLEDSNARVQEIAAAAAAAATAAIVQQLHLFQNGPVPSEPAPPLPPPTPPPDESSEHFTIEDWNNYAGFRAHVIGLWKEGMTREVLAGLAGCGRRTFYRARKHWRVNDIWPPTDWPLEKPRPKARRNPRRLPGSRELGGLAAAGWLFFATLDSLDGRLDGLIRVCLKTIVNVFGSDTGRTLRF